MAQTLRLPFYIVSGGITEIIEASFHALLTSGDLPCEDTCNYYLDKVKIFSNGFLYEEDRAVGFTRPVIHILNKQQFIYEHDHEFRKNVILMGDVLEDVGMVKETKHDVVVKVGFLNEPKNYDQQIEEFKKAYDLVVVGDGSLLPVYYLLKKLFSEEITGEEELLLVNSANTGYLELRKLIES